MASSFGLSAAMTRSVAAVVTKSLYRWNAEAFLGLPVVGSSRSKSQTAAA
jgi:hypothetical protein